MTKAIASSGSGKSAARQLAETFSAETLDSLIKDAVKSGTPIDGADGLLNELTKAVLERALDSELTHHLGYEAGDPAGRGSGNSRNGSTPKTVSTVNGPVAIAVPRDRNGSFEPAIVPKKVRRLGNLNVVDLSDEVFGSVERLHDTVVPLTHYRIPFRRSRWAGCLRRLTR